MLFVCVFLAHHRLRGLKGEALAKNASPKETRRPACLFPAPKNFFRAKTQAAAKAARRLPAGRSDGHRSRRLHHFVHIVEVA
jgi:hypothetical protein